MTSHILVNSISDTCSIDSLIPIISDAKFLFPEYTNLRLSPSQIRIGHLCIKGDRPQTDAEYALYCDYVAAEEAGAREHEQKERAEYERLKAIFGDE
mgnify:FL=1